MIDIIEINKNMEHLPDDIVFNVLSWLPVKTLFRLRCVSTLWRTTIDTHAFASDHLSRRSEQPKALLLFTNTSLAHHNYEDNGNNLLRVRLNRKVHAFQGSCNGLLCFTTHCTTNGVNAAVIVFSPVRRQVLSLPPVAASRRKYGLGFDSNTNTYKVVCVSLQDSRVCTVSSEPMSWRPMFSKPPCPVLGKAVSANGAVHWIADNENMKTCKIVCFDIGKEEFGVISCPEMVVCHLVDLRGVLGIVDCSFDTHIEVWVLRDYEKKEWVREYRIQIHAPEEVGDNWNTQVLGLWGGSGEMLLRYMQSFLVYKPESNEMRYMHIPGLDLDTEVYCHTSSMVSLSQFLPH